MKILLISNGFAEKNGWSVYTKTLSDGLEKDGHTVFHASDLGSPLSYYSSPFTAIRNVHRLKKHIQNIQPDVIHITVEPYSAMLPLLGKRIASKTILTIHGSYGIRMFQGFVNKRRSRWILTHIHKCIAVSNYTKMRVTEELTALVDKKFALLFKRKTEVITNGVTLPASISSPKNTVKQIICVGGVKPRKGLLESLKALYLYVKTIDKGIHFTICGTYNPDNAYVQDLQNYIHAHSLKSYVTFTGTLSDEELQSQYAQSDLYLMPAKTTPNTFEGFGIVYIEAAGYGIPCIGPTDSGAAEAIKNGESGYKCDPDDTESIIRAMENILLHEKIKRESCRNWAEKHTTDTMISSIESLYQSLI
ncbi:hypothetical protein COU75_03830 [Candidatus Peregrinibacteria bacterium CG10_big_fil_rev_8_21_14_0_10_42_8]|nr:MAG: hypothetical protein COU75_03830 [Candidatus Peregrinibacteria bacterium CG10_big_fil_rev_8_21_14_0_10_42_8]